MEKNNNPKKRHIHVSSGRMYITSSFNNTIITLTDDHGNTVAWSTSGANGFKGTKKGTPFAAQITMNKVLEKGNLMD